MAIILEADSRALTQASKYSALVTNYQPGVTDFFVLNATDSDFTTNAFILLSQFGAEDAEILTIANVNNQTGEITTTTPTLFAHAESSRVSVIPYNTARFFWTQTETFSIANPLSGFVPIQSSDWFTSYSDESHASGYGWYAFYNTITSVYSQPSNAIPYIGFDTDMVEQILSDFFSMLNNKELRLVTRADALSWASEGYTRMKNKLNLSNIEYSASPVQILNLMPGVIEYPLPFDFDHMIAIGCGVNPSNPVITDWRIRGKIDFIPLTEAYTYNGTGPRYYIRGAYLGILPPPQNTAYYFYIYGQKAMRLTLNTDVVYLPNGLEYVIKDWMLYRAYTKFQNAGMATASLTAYTNGLNDAIIASVKRDANNDVWGITREANV